MPEVHMTEEAQTVAVPVTIHTVEGGAFVVTDIDAWSYQELGVFATGHWYGYEEDDKKVRDVLIPFARIDHMEFDFDALTEFTVEEFIEEATSEKP